MTEDWKDVTGYEGYYEVSNYGRVRSKDRYITKANGVVQHRRSRLKIQTESNDGYLYVKLSKNGKDRKIGVHVLVATAFVEGFSDEYEVNHKDFDRKNNLASNLEWVTHLENIEYTINAGRHISQIRDMKSENNPNYGNRKLSDKYLADPFLAKCKQSRPGAKNGRARPVDMVLECGESIRFPYMEECARYLIANRIVKSKNVTSVASYISRAAESGRPYYGQCFRFSCNT